MFSFRLPQQFVAVTLMHLALDSSLTITFAGNESNATKTAKVSFSHQAAMRAALRGG